jgi:peptidoglycan/LPS O-acetylase OafA/YrhL
VAPKLKHFYSLDNLRGAAALLVVVYHWGHFFYDAPNPFHPAPSLLPLYWLLWPVYQQGLMAVDLFFCLSGFIFFWLYAQKIQKQQMGFGRFLILRFSRLYPLHFATLLAVAAASYWFYLNGLNPFRSLLHNDWYHFVL